MLKKISLFLITSLFLFVVVGCNFQQTPDNKEEKFTVSFECEMECELESVEVLNGELVEEPKLHEHSGFVFLGWYNGENLWDFENDEVSKDLTLTARWEEHTHEFIDGKCECGELEPEPTKYKLSFDTDGGYIIDDVMLEAGETIIVPNSPTKEGFTFKGWSPAVPEVMPEHDLAVKAIWEVKTFTIKFNTGAGTKIDTLTYEYGAIVTAPKDPTRDGYIFVGWNAEIPERMPAKNLTFTAKWEGQIKTISYYLNDGLLLETYPTDFKVGVGTTLPTPTKEGYEFGGWYTNAEFTGTALNKIATTVITDVTLYAKWTIEAQKVTYNLNGGNWQYSTRDEMVEDFLNDAMAWGGKTGSRPDGMVQGAGTTQVGFANKFSAIYGIFSDPTYGPKWAWLKDYIINVTSNSSSKSYLSQGNEAFWRYSLGAFLFEEHRSSYPVSEDFTVEAAANGFWTTLSEKSQATFDILEGAELKTPIRIYYVFKGWYDNPEFTGNPVTELSSKVTLYAKWEEEVPVQSISITNKVEGLDRFETYQLTWELNPTNAAIKEVEFYTSDASIATINDKGLIETLANGTVTITIKSLSPSGVTDTVTINVTSPDYFDVSYESTSFANVGEKIKLNAEYIKRDGSKPNLVFSSLNLDIAEVDTTGLVTAKSQGVATIRVQLESDANIYFDFVVTVLPTNLSAAQQFMVDSHESNIFSRYDLGIGAGTPVYYADIFGSINKMIFNYDAVWQDDYLAACVANGQYSTGINGVEFVVVHYTAGMTVGSDAAATAAYFSRAEGVSAHFCTGNDGIFQTLNLTDRGWHAGDGASSTFEWNPTGVKYNESDPKWPVWGISKNAKFTINGEETSIQVPYKDQRGNEGYVTDEKWLNDQGFAFKVVNGEYYMGTTWWCYSNVYEGRICSRGGNKHGIGIESAVDEGSDLWYTWQVTAKLVAQLMIKFNLDITRVVGHHFFAAKDCPQPLLENDLEIWWEFIDLVQAEYEALTTYKNSTFELIVKDGGEIVNEFGRIIAQPEYSKVVTYEVRINNGTSVETVTLATMVPGQYTK